MLSAIPAPGIFCLQLGGGWRRLGLSAFLAKNRQRNLAFSVRLLSDTLVLITLDSAGVKSADTCPWRGSLEAEPLPYRCLESLSELKVSG